MTTPLRSLLPLLILAATASAAIEPKIAPFTPAVDDKHVGDYTAKGSSYVAQLIIDEHGDYRASVLKDLVTDDQPTAVLHGKVSEPATMKGAGWKASLSGDQLVLTSAEGKEISLTHSERTSPTMGAKAPAGAVVLWDGSNQDAWAYKSGKDWLKEAGPATWKQLPDGVLEVVAGSDCIITHRKFGDCHVHVEFKTLGWKSNSGVFLEDRYESNINETYGRFDEAPNGGYDNCTPKEDRLHVRPCFPPLVWQTFDIDFTAPKFDQAGNKTAPARSTVYFNGVKIYDNKALSEPSGAANRLGEAPTGPLMLQEHGMPVQFRNIWLLPKAP